MIEQKVVPLGTTKLLAVEVETSIDDQLSADCIQPATVQIIHEAGRLFSDRSGFSVDELMEVLQGEAVQTILAAEFMHQAKRTDCIFYDAVPIAEEGGFSVTIMIAMIPVGSRNNLN